MIGISKIKKPRNEYNALAAWAERAHYWESQREVRLIIEAQMKKKLKDYEAINAFLESLEKGGVPIGPIELDVEEVWEHRHLIPGDPSWHPGRLENLTVDVKLTYEERCVLRI